MGQRPDAHFIQMDQNQLSAYVQQDSFPLFSNSSGSQGASEFHEYLRRILTDRIPFDDSFSDSVYNETRGHPFLTVKLLVSFVDWLISQKRPLRGLFLKDCDFREFSNCRLNPRDIASSQEYVFFEKAISEATGEDGKANTPWLYAVYSTMRRVVESSPTVLRCTRGEFSDHVEGLGIPEATGITPEELLRTASMANFFGYDDDSAWIRVPILGRICGTTRPKIGR